MSVNFNCRYCVEWEVSVVFRQLCALYFCKWQFRTLDITYTLRSLFLSASRNYNSHEANLPKEPRLSQTKLRTQRTCGKSFAVNYISSARGAGVMKGNLKRAKSELVINASRLLINRTSSLGVPRRPYLREDAPTGGSGRANSTLPEKLVQVYAFRCRSEVSITLCSPKSSPVL